jgi:hypothetical protein
VKLLGYVLENENQYEEIESIQRPAQIGCDDGVSLLGGQGT